MSTSTRILLVFLLLVTAGFHFLLDQLTKRVERQYLEATEESMVDAAHVLASYVQQQLEGDELRVEPLRRAFDEVHRRSFEARIYSLMKTVVDMNVYVTDRTGVVVYDSRDGQAEGEDYSRYHDVRRTLAGGYGARSTRTNEEDELSSIMYVGAPIHLNREIVGVLSVSKPQASMFAFMNETRGHIRLYGWSILLGTALAAMLVSHWLFRPIRRLTEYARAVHRGERVGLPRLASPEARTLGTALEAMRDSLEDRKYVETYVQTLTHEMKSPVAAIRGAAELLQEPDMPPGQRERFLENIRTETDRLQSVIDRLLTLSMIEGRKSLEHREEVDLAGLIATLHASHQSALESRGLQLEEFYEDHPVVRGEAFLLEVAVANLIQNAIDFSPDGGVITLRVRCDAEKNESELVVEDEGPGVPEYALSRVFERFYSLRHPHTGRKSSGLGLCFVREAAALHGGSARIENRSDRTGARAVLRLGRG